MAGWMAHSAQHAHYIGIYRGLPERYPIFPNFIPGKPEQLCAHLPTNCHTFGSLEASLRLISIINLRIEPRALSRYTRSSTPGV